MRRKTAYLVAGICLAALLAGCNGNTTVTDEVSTELEIEADDVPVTTEAQIATGSDLSAELEVVEEDMIPLYGESIKDGTYDIEVDASSSMFPVVRCKLTVQDGQMTAVMTMGGKGYRYIYMGTGQEAVNADASSYISYVEDETGAHTYTVPVEALDKGISCAAFSDKKEKWYERTLVFRADSLPFDALQEDAVTTVEDLCLSDGSYTIEVTLSGGSGKAFVEAPSTLQVENGVATAVIVMSSPNYDYMIVGEETYAAINTEGNSAFEIPVYAFDYNVPVKADTTAMSTPHEIDYTLYFDSKTIK